MEILRSADTFLCTWMSFTVPPCSLIFRLGDKERAQPAAVAEIHFGQAASGGAAAAGGVGLGGNEPAHVIAAQAEMRRTTDEATFRGQARLWQGANSVSAPVIVLNRTRQTLAAHGGGAAQPVNLVLLSAANPERAGKKEGG